MSTLSHPGTLECKAGRKLRALALAKVPLTLRNLRFPGQVHKYTSNCLTCGRIQCSQEKGDACPFCGYLLDETPDMGELMQRLADRSATSVYGTSLNDAQALTRRLVETDAEGRVDVIDEATDDFGLPSFVGWESVEKVHERIQVMQDMKDREKKSKQTLHLSTMLGI
ncbi:hypothetical protein PSACC_01598 [Paramicrosporidium saccamoebae]|uniref:TRIP4/RQT4 C2HC5-type zinc finger domain-containing protein n=1 Tax=Paramicrosporidium saccamoebae TaxID=1246581 RepID=A0A2H9TLH1_9FUNG|nr:hypothetical protein PSACC_01598 [Paramicrosporidium saccamoebae]